jgi:uncharacterized phage-associated protein
MTRWTKTDKDLAAELEMYMAQVRLYGAKNAWTIQDKGKPWDTYYRHSSALFRKIRASRRNRIESLSA